MSITLDYFKRSSWDIEQGNILLSLTELIKDEYLALFTEYENANYFVFSPFSKVPMKKLNWRKNNEKIPIDFFFKVKYFDERKYNTDSIS